MAFAPLIIAAVGTIASVAGEIKKGKEAKKTANINARNAEEEAAIERDKALRDEESQRRDANSIQARSRAALAESGLSRSGSTARLIEQGAIDAELDGLNIRYGGQLRSRGLLSQATELRRQGKVASRNSKFLAGQALLSGGGQVASAAAGLRR